jgi:Ca2+/Na+ antiporter
LKSLVARFAVFLTIVVGVVVLIFDPKFFLVLLLCATAFYAFGTIGAKKRREKDDYKRMVSDIQRRAGKDGRQF